MRIFKNFMDNIGEDKRWNGRTQSGASWSPDQLRHDLRLQVESVAAEDRAEGRRQEVPVPDESSTKVLERSGSRSS
jgi:hypothetical protein